MVRNLKLTKKKIKVLFLTATFPSLKNPISGTFVYEQAKALSKFVPILVLALISQALPLKRHREYRVLVSKIPKRETKGKIEINYVKYLQIPSFLDFLSSITPLLSVLQQVKLKTWKEIDIIHTHMAGLGWLGVKLGKIFKKPVVITCHGSDIYIGTQDLPEYRWRRKRIIWALKKCQKVIVVSNALKEKVVELGISKEKVEVIPNGFDKQRFYLTNQDDARKKLKLPLNKKIILYVGNLVPIKGVNFLIEAVSFLTLKRNDFLLTIIGDGELREFLEKQVRELNLTDLVKLIGKLPHKEISLWMNACDLLVLPSLNEGWPTVLSEVLACGKPVVASKVGGIPEIIKNKNLGLLVKPRNSKSLAEALNHALNLRWDSKYIASQVQEFSWERISQKIYGIYQDLIINEKL